jgi:hypothetical protein
VKKPSDRLARLEERLHQLAMEMGNMKKELGAAAEKAELAYQRSHLLESKIDRIRSQAFEEICALAKLGIQAASSQPPPKPATARSSPGRNPVQRHSSRLSNAAKPRPPGKTPPPA